MTRWCMLILCLLLLAAEQRLSGADADPAANGIIVLEWSIRQEVEEVLAELPGEREQQPEALENLRHLLQRHGHRAFPQAQRFRPVSEVAARALIRHDLLEAWRLQFATVARREWEAARDAGDEEALLAVALTYPLTTAAEQAWRLLADRAWDSGRLGLYLAWGNRGGEADHPQRRQRLAAARRLLHQQTPPDLPSNLDDLSKMWSLREPQLAAPVDFDEQPGRGRQGRRRGMEMVAEKDARPLFAVTGDGATVAVNSGTHFGLIDPLVGTLINQPLRLGLPGSAQQPVINDHGLAIALAFDDTRRYVLLASDARGEQRWRQQLDVSFGRALVSDPILVDQLVAVAVLHLAEDGSQLRVLGFAHESGELIFNTPVAKNTNDVQMRWGGGLQQGSLRSPLLSSHGGTLLAGTDYGLLAQLGADGSLLSIWTSDDDTARALTGQRSRRPPALVSDGRFAILAQGHGGGLYMVDADQDRSAGVLYTGNGSGDHLLAAREGMALLAGHRATLLDIESREVLWSQPLNHNERSRWGLIGEDHVLIAGSHVLSLLDRSDGRVVSQRFFASSSSLTVAAGVIIANDGENFIGYGDRSRFQQRLTEAMAADPDDYRPLLAMSGLARAQDHDNEAYAYLIQALERGAPELHARDAARLLRRGLQRQLGQRQQLDSLLERLEKLQPYLPYVRHERHWWLARHYEINDFPERAAEAYAQAAAGTSAMLDLAHGLRADLHALAAAGLARTATAPQPAWLALSSQAATSKDQAQAADAHQDWVDQRPRLGGALVATSDDQSLAVSYTAGDLIALDVQSGEEVWRRQGDHRDPAMVGVSFTPNDPGRSIRVIPGTAAAAAGLKDGDRILEYDGVTMTTLDDLIGLVAKRKVGDPFRVQVQRDDQQLELSGHLGSYIMLPVASNDSWIIARRTQLQTNGDLTTSNDPPELRIISAHNGQQLWRRSFPAFRDGQPPGPPLLIGPHLLWASGTDLVAFDLRPLAAGKALGKEPSWRIADAADTLFDPQLVGESFLMVEEQDSATIGLLDVTSGKILFQVPAGGGSGRLLLRQGELVIADEQQHLSAWQLGLGQRKWHNPDQRWRPLALHGDSLLALSERRELALLERANGTRRRLISELQLVEHAVVHGNRAYIHARNAQGQHYVAGVGLDSGSVLWQRLLPAESELTQAPQSDAWGVNLRLSSLSGPPALLSLNTDGEIRAAINLEPEMTVTPLRQGLLLSNDQALRHYGAELPGALPRVPTIALEPEARLPQISEQLVAKLPWQSVGDSAYGLAYQGTRLVVAVRLDRDTPGLTIRIGNQGPAIDPFNQRLRMTRGEAPSLSTHPDGWRLNAFHRLADDAEGNWYGLCVLSPPALQEFQRRPQVLVSSPDQTPPGPWWWRRWWRTVSRPPGEGAP